MMKRLIYIVLGLLVLSCGTELDNSDIEVPENSNFLYSSTVKYYTRPGTPVAREATFQGYLTLQTSSANSTASVEVQPEYGSQWYLTASALNRLNADTSLYRIEEQSVYIDNDDFSVVGMEVFEDNGIEYHLLQTADSIIIRYNSFLPQVNAEYQYTEGEIRGRRFR